MAKEYPILFTGPMVRAILEGRKTQTRRIVKIHAGNRVIRNGYYIEMHDIGLMWKPVGGQPWEPFPKDRTGEYCPYGKVGDRLWVRETWRPDVNENDISGYLYKADDCFIEIENSEKAADQWLYLRKPEEQWPVMKPPVWRPSIHMPRVASRLLLEVVNVRVERLQDISEEDAIAEGVEPYCGADYQKCFSCSHRKKCQFDGLYRDYTTEEDGFPANAKNSFKSLWDSINRDRGHRWDTNPWVWVVEFKRVEANETLPL